LLCDCPGLVFPTFMNTKAGLLCNGILPIDRMRDHMAPVQWICNRISAEQFESTYNLKLTEVDEHLEPSILISHSSGRSASATDLLNTYARQRGFMASNGRPDDSRASRIVLKDFTKGKLLYCHPPPHLDDDSRLVYFNSLQKTSIMFKLEDPESLSKRFEIDAKRDAVLGDMIREKEAKKLAALNGTKMTRKDRARMKAHARKGMSTDQKFRRTQGVFFGAEKN
jgi:hypothetical protein